MSPSTSEPSPQNSSEEEGQEDPLDLVLEELLKELSPQSSEDPHNKVSKLVMAALQLRRSEMSLSTSLMLAALQLRRSEMSPLMLSALQARRREMSPSTSEPSPQNSSEEEGQEDPLDLVLEELLKELSPQSSAPTASHGNDEVSSHGNDEVSFTIRFSLSTFETLKDMSGGGSIAETLRDAIALSKWFTDTLKTGSKIYVKRNGKMHEVVKI